MFIDMEVKIHDTHTNLHREKWISDLPRHVCGCLITDWGGLFAQMNIVWHSLDLFCYVSVRWLAALKLLYIFLPMWILSPMTLSRVVVVLM